VSRRVLIAGNKFDWKEIGEILGSDDLVMKQVSNPALFMSEARSWLPDLVIFEEKFAGSPALFVSNLRKEFSRVAMKVMMASESPSLNLILDLIKKGCDDVVKVPLHPRAMALRARYQLQEREIFAGNDLYADPTMAPAALEVFFSSISRLVQEDFYTNLSACLFEVARATKSLRINMIRILDLSQDRAIRVVSSDDADEKFERLAEVDLNQYPEVREAVLRKAVVFIKNIDASPLTQHVRSKLKNIEMDSIVVCPMIFAGRCEAVL
jgi:DNA-binding response OmpR family regulator